MSQIAFPNSGRKSCFSYLQRKLPEIVKCRSVHLGDVPDLKKMVQTSTNVTFGFEDIETIFQLSISGVVALTSNDDIAGCIFVNNYPNIPSVPPWDWTSWIRNKFRMNDASSRNTLFIKTLVYDPVYTRYFLEPLLSKLFMKFVFCKYIIFVNPPKTKFLEWIGDHGTIITTEGSSEFGAQSLRLFLRQNFVMNYKLRMGVLEDNDDLVPLLDTHSKRLKNTYGSYYISEIIANDKGRRVIVAEQEEKAVAVMIFNECVNYKFLNKSFHLECYYGLKKPHQDDSRNCLQDVPDSSIYEIGIYDIPELSHKGSSINLEVFNVPYSQSVVDNSTDLNVHLEEIIFSTSSSTMSGVSALGDLKGLPSPFYGVINNKFSCHALNFTEAQQEELKITGATSRTRHSTALSAQMSSLFNVMYKGGENAFALEVMAAQKDHEGSLFDLLNAGFELFPNKDYCVLCIPANAPSVPLLSQFMVNIPPTPTSYFPQELYLAHRYSITNDVYIRGPKEEDLYEVEDFLEKMKNGREILKKFMECYRSRSTNHQAYVIRCASQIVGIVNLRDMNNLDYIMSRYQISKVTDLSVHKPGCHGEIIHFVLSPIFQNHSKYLLMELHRLSDYSILFYILHPEGKHVGIYRKSAVACVLGNLIPIMPNKLPDYSKIETDRWNLVESLERIERPYAVYISTPMHCSKNRQDIDQRIIVVGASEVGLSFLINLIFNKIPNFHTIFNNITLVSTHGLLRYKNNRNRDVMIPSTSQITSGYYLAQLSLGTYVDVVEGVMSAIDRQNQTILVNSTWLHYDMLFLTCGTQYQMPTKASENTDGAIEYPENVFVINTPEDVDVAMGTLSKIAKESWDFDPRRRRVIIYGSSIEAYCCVETLLNVKVAEIVFVESPHSSKVGCVSIFDDIEVEREVKTQIRKSGVKLLEKYKFYEWTFDDTQKRIISICFKGNKFVHIDCMAAFMYGRKRISKLTFDAINNANLIFDGELVIDNEFKTNDPNIYAAGTLTKYPRRFYADHMKHKYFNQVEIGERMARSVLKKLLPTITHHHEKIAHLDCPLNKANLVHRYYRPIYTYAKIPRNLEFFYVRKPGISVPMDIASAGDDFGQLFTTGHLRNLSKQGYFKLHLNQYNTVETILAVSKRPIETTNLSHVWGKHESILDNLVLRFEMAKITDLFTFFSKPWMYGLYHNGFHHLQNEINEVLANAMYEPKTSILEYIKEKVKENHYEKLTNAQFKEIFERLSELETKSEIENMVIKFLAQQNTYLPMYLIPSFLPVKLGAYDKSPLFKKM